MKKMSGKRGRNINTEKTVFVAKKGNCELLSVR